MALVGFKVRQLHSAKEVETIFTSRDAVLGWKPGANDHLSTFAADESGFFAGELDGKVISCLSIVKYSKEYAFVAQYIVDKPHRGKGYGLETWKFAFTSVDDDCNCALTAVEDMVTIYERCGFKAAWRLQSTTMKVSLVSFGSKHRVAIKPVTEVPFDELLKYDTSVHVYARPSFLEKWISAPNCLSYAAVSQEGCVTGYAVVRTAFRKEDGWLAGPIFADNSQIARSLYQAVIEGVAAQDPTSCITVDVPYGDGCNPESLSIAAEFSGEPELSVVRMYTRGVPPGMPIHKVFGVTSIQLG